MTGPVDVLALCRELVAAPSENPPGDETRVAAAVAGILAAAGFEVRGYELVEGRPNVVATLRRAPGRRLIFQAHGDTKPAGPAGAWRTDPFEPQERGGLLYGLGSCDTKGGLAAQVAAACALAAEPTWTGELVVQAVADEEDGSRLGAEHLLSLGLLEADAAVVAEPTGCLPSVAQLGNAWAEITITGRAAHAGHPERGVDAFRAAAAFTEAVDRLLTDQPTSADFPGHPRLNVGEFTMAGHPGTVPGVCRLRCDIRVLPGVARDGVLGLYRTAADQVVRSHGVLVQVEPYQGSGCQSHEIDSEHLLARAFRRALHETGQPSRTLPFAGGTDARYFAMAGTPALVHGPGSLEQAHAPDEYVPIAELRLAVRQLVHVGRSFLGGSGAPR